MKEYTIINDNDPNDTFTVKANSPDEACYKALEALGWWVAEGGAEEDEEDEED